MGKKIKLNTFDSLLAEHFTIEANEAKEAGALGYMARSLVQATLPHSKMAGNEFVRKNGAYTLTILAPSEIGLPYGSIPRLLTAWVTTEAVRTKSYELELGNTLSEFMRELGLVPTGGRWGSITSLREQIWRLFSCSISCHYENEDRRIANNYHIASKAELWWDPQRPKQSSLWQSTVTLSQDFFKEIIENPIPIDMRALKALKRSPMALDIYCWLTYRMSYLRKPGYPIPWEALQLQFGAGYPFTAQGKSDFKKKFLLALKKVLIIYRAEIEITQEGLVLIPGLTHIKKRG
jgi:hypothetical protein